MIAPDVHCLDAAEAALRLRPSGPTCPCGHTTAPDECECCETFRCAGCRRWFHWADGAGDDAPELCDGCWAAVHREAS